METKSIIKLEHWIRKADQLLIASKILGNPVVHMKYSTGTIDWYLLHQSIETYLKAVQLNDGKKVPLTHNLKSLVSYLEEIPEFNEVLNKELGGRNIIKWLIFINPFGFPEGGVKYLSGKNNMFAAPANVHSMFDELILKIKSYCDLEKLIHEQI